MIPKSGLRFSEKRSCSLKKLDRDHDSNSSDLGLGWIARQGLIGRRCPAVDLLGALGIAVESFLERSERDDEARPAVAKPGLEDIVLEKPPDAVAERGPH